MRLVLSVDDVLRLAGWLAGTSQHFNSGKSKRVEGHTRRRQKEISFGLFAIIASGLLEVDWARFRQFLQSSAAASSAAVCIPPGFHLRPPRPSFVEYSSSSSNGRRWSCVVVRSAILFYFFPPRLTLNVTPRNLQQKMMGFRTNGTQSKGSKHPSHLRNRKENFTVTNQ